MKTKGDAGDKLNAFITKHGIPSSLHTDGAKEEQLGKWNEVRKKFLHTQTSTEPHTPQQNRTELEIRDTKDHYRRIMDRKRVPEALWDFGITYTTDVRQVISRPNLDYRSAIEVLTGNTPDISNFLDFEFYQWIKYFDPAAFPSSREMLGRWLGHAHGVGEAPADAYNHASRLLTVVIFLQIPLGRKVRLDLRDGSAMDLGTQQRVDDRSARIP